MELLERYLQAVRGYLLRRRRDDIVKELGDNILSQMEDRAEELGRPLNEIEQAAILKLHGHPLLAAARYRRMPMQQLIGPALFPLYWYLLQALLVFVTAFHVVLAGVVGLTRGSVFEGLVVAWGSFWLWVLVAVGGITVAFGLIEYFGGGKVPFTETFDPRDLPEIKRSAPPRGNSLAELVLGGLFLIVWPAILHLPAPPFARSSPVHLAPVWWRFEIPMLLVMALGTAAAFVSVFRPKYSWLRSALRLASDVAGAVTFYLLLLTGEFIVIGPNAPAQLNDPVHVGSHVFTAGQIANAAAGVAPLILLITFFCDGLLEAARLLRPRRNRGIVSHESNGIL
jgi:hypothetical protein